jgi:glucose-1-phosphate cytidylyltransferase
MDFTLTLGNRDSLIFHGSHDEDDWTVSVVDTGQETMTGGRIKRIQNFIGDEDFFVTYGDGIADVDINALIQFHNSHGLDATMTVTRPHSRFGVVDIDSNGVIGRFREKPQMDDFVNIGYFILKPSVFDLINGDQSVFEETPLHTLAENSNIAAFKHTGFWQPMDTVRESQLLNELWSRGNPPWKIW